MKPLLISPHLDDAVLSAGRFLAANPGSMVATVFAGIPRDKKFLGEYDKKMGFPSSETAMRVRRAEDEAALKVLGALYTHENYFEEAYRKDEPTYAVVLQHFIKLAENADCILGPLGIRHPDHIKTRQILGLLAYYIDKPIYLWADLPYRVTDPGSAWELAGKLKKAELIQGDANLKLQALMKYESQWDKDDLIPKNVMVAEEFWRLT